MRKWIAAALSGGVAQFALAGALGTADAWAQTAPGLEEITVTARHRSENLQSTPIAITALTGANLEARGMTSIAQIADATPNLHIDFTAPVSGSSNATSIYVRGVGQSDFLLTNDPGVGLYLDGVYVARSVGGALDLLDVERVETLRGPQGTLFGKNTIGGAISITSRQPSDKFEGSGELTVGGDHRVDVRGSVNVPLNQTLFAKVAVSSKSRDGYARRLLDGGELGDENSVSARGQLRWLASDRVTVNFAADLTRSREDSVASTALGSPATFGRGVLTDLYNQFVAPTKNVPGFGTNVRYDRRWLTNDPYTTYQTGPNGSDLDVHGLALTVSWDLGPAQLKSITAYRNMKASFGRDPDNSPLDIVSTHNVFHHDQFSQELQLGGKAFGDRLTWLAGLYAFSESGTDDLAAVITPDLYRVIGVPVSVGGRALIDNDSYAAFAQGTYKLTDALSVTAGLRYTQENKQLRNRQVLTDLNLPLLTDQDSDKTFRNWSPRFGFEYQVTDQILTYASVSRGFKSGGFTGRYVEPAAAAKPFNPEKVTSYEIGFKADLFDKRVRLNGAAFYSDYTDIQVVVFEGVAPVTRNAASGTIRGGELELTVRPTAPLLLTAGLGYIDASYDKVDPATGILPSNRFVNTPKISFNASAEYTLPLVQNLGTVVLRGDYSYRSKVAKDAINTPELVQAGFGLFNARVTYESPDARWELALAGRNLTDKRYLESGTADKATFGIVEGIYARPREWMVSGKYRF